MSYRIDGPKPRPRPRRSLAERSTPLTLHVDYGESLRFALPCYYLEPKAPVPVSPHRRDLHDMAGAPTPRRPDDSCQEWDFDPRLRQGPPHMPCPPPRVRALLDPNCLLPIHLSEEFGSVSLRSPLYLKGDDGMEPADGALSCSLDSDRDWIIRGVLDTVKVSAIDPVDMVAPDAEARELFFSILLDVTTETESYVQRAAQGRIVILPCPYAK